MALFVQTMKLLIVFLVASQALTQELNSTLHSTLYGVPVTYVDETVVFRCTVRGSNSMAWTSDEYIGTGGQQLEISAAERPGTPHPAVGNSQTVAVLISAMMDENLTIVSELRIRIRPNYPSASVWCDNINAGTASSIEFLLADATSIDCDKQSSCPGETVTCTCTTGNSTSLAWTNNDDRLTFASTDALGTRRSISGSSTFATLTNSSNRNGITVITSNLTFVASISMRFTCENIDRSISESAIIPISDFPIVTRIENCANINTAGTGQVTTPAEGDSSGDTCNRTGPITAAVVVPIIATIIAIIVIIVTVAIACHKIKTLKKAKDEEIKILEETEDKKIKILEETKKEEIKILEETKQEEIKMLEDTKKKEIKKLEETKKKEIKILEETKDNAIKILKDKEKLEETKDKEIEKLEESKVEKIEKLEESKVKKIEKLEESKVEKTKKLENTKKEKIKELEEARDEDIKKLEETKDKEISRLRGQNRQLRAKKYESTPPILIESDVAV